MSAQQPRPAAETIRWSGVVAIILAGAAFLLMTVAPGLHLIALILGLAAVLVGVVSSVNARHQTTPLRFNGYIGAVMGAIASVTALFLILA
jgi:hypothetical protein